MIVAGFLLEYCFSQERLRLACFANAQGRLVHVCCSAAAPPVHFVEKKSKVFPLPLKRLLENGIGQLRNK